MGLGLYRILPLPILYGVWHIKRGSRVGYVSDMDIYGAKVKVAESYCSSVDNANERG